MKIGIFSGCFNPVHKTHVDLVNNLLEKGVVDKIEIIPAYANINIKNSEIIEAKYRKNMLNLAFKGNDKVHINTLEIDRNQQLYTFETLKILKDELKEDIYLIIGSDNLRTFDKWKNYEEILSKYKVIVTLRDNDDMDKIIIENPNLIKYRSSFIKNNAHSKTDISSTFIRNNIKDLDKIKSVLNDEVLEYIKENNLYE